MSQPVFIRNAVGGSYTSAKRAVELMAQGTAKFIDDKTIEMLDTSHRHQSAVRSIEDGRRIPAKVMHSTTPIEITSYQYAGPANLRTFCTYPLDAANAFRKAA